MNIKELYEVGLNFEAFMGVGSKSERDRIPKNYSRINLEEDDILRIKSIDEKILFLVVGEPWCMDFQLNITVLKKICENNDNLDFSIITKGRGEKYLKPILEMEEFKIPLIVPLNEKYEICGEIFKERPEIVKKLNFEEIKIDYLKGKYLKNTFEDILKNIGK
ncbi:thioredoxin family protein [Cetobacterium sp. SF1]|uniref:thioredoxin family protein n=1 Tax=unclassified Cetobacterium TaxID=2630983 RepID=UPI003CECE3A2